MTTELDRLIALQNILSTMWIRAAGSGDWIECDRIQARSHAIWRRIRTITQ